MKEYYADIEITNEIEEWLLLQEATVVPTYNGTVDRRMRAIQTYDVYFGHRKIHFYAGTKQARIFFNDETIGAALILFIKWPTAIFKHNFPKEMLLST